MRSDLRPALLAAALATLAPGIVRADDLDALRAENARLRARVDALERENERLRGAASAAEPPIPTHVVERETDDGKTVWATEPGRLEVAGRAVHWIWLERTPGQPGATLWIRGEYSGGIYRQVEHLDLELDGAAQTLPLADYDATRITVGMGHNPQRRDHETLHFTLDPQALEALAKAATMSGKVGRTSFTVPTDVLASLRALARKQA
jgi:hypothetical protein